MMHYASQGVRNAARKGSSVLVHHGGHNGPGGGTTANVTTRSLHHSNNLLGASRAHPPLPYINTLDAIRPRNPPHRLFSASKNFLQRIFTHLTAPGLRAPTLPQYTSGRSLQKSFARASSTQSGLSTAARHPFKTNTLQRQANLFLPRAPAPVPPRFGGVAQVGLGTARNFTTGRPIFQQLAENVPITARALYQVNWDIETQKERVRMRSLLRGQPKTVRKSKEMLKPSQKVNLPFAKELKEKPIVVEQEFEHYFSEIEAAPVTTYLLIPLAPTPSARMPLPLDPDLSPREPRLLPPLSYLGAMHVDHSTHALRVSTLFTRLDQANVWERGGVTCSAYSQGLSHQRQGLEDNDGNGNSEGICTILKVEFVGWTKAEVRGVLGESGSGWCVLEEINGESMEDEVLSDPDSLASEILEEDRALEFRSPDIPEIFGLNQGLHDPTESFVLPKLEFSSTIASDNPGSSTQSIALGGIPHGIEVDPWMGELEYSSSSSESSFSDLSSLILAPPSENGYFGQNPGLGIGFSAETLNRFGVVQPRESMFY